MRKRVANTFIPAQLPKQTYSEHSITCVDVHENYSGPVLKVWHEQQFQKTKTTVKYMFCQKNYIGRI